MYKLLRQILKELQEIRRILESKDESMEIRRVEVSKSPKIQQVIEGLLKL